MPGYIKVYRDLREHWLWKIKRRFSKAEAWIDIMFRCNHKCQKLPNGYGVKWVLRGQFVSSYYEMAKEWDWSEAATRKFFKQLENDGMILVKSRTKNSTFEVINYCARQSLDITELELYGIRTENAQNTHNARTTHARRTPNKNEKNEKNIKDFSLEFQKFRQRYDANTLNNIDRYFEILRTTRVSGKISDSIVYQVYAEMDKHPPIVVKYACSTVINKPDLHSKKENYFYGIMRNTGSDEAAHKLSEKPLEQNSKVQDGTHYKPSD